MRHLSRCPSTVYNRRRYPSLSTGHLMDIRTQGYMLCELSSNQCCGKSDIHVASGIIAGNVAAFGDLVIGACVRSKARALRSGRRSHGFLGTRNKVSFRQVSVRGELPATRWWSFSSARVLFEAVEMCRRGRRDWDWHGWAL